MCIFEVTPLVIINKFDINKDISNVLGDYSRENGIHLLGNIPFDPAVTRSMVMGIPVVEYDPNAASSKAIQKKWQDSWQH